MNRITKILLSIVIIALLGFFLGVPYYEDIITKDKIDQLKNEKLKATVSIAFKSNAFAKLPFSVRNYLRATIKNNSVSPLISHISIAGKMRTSPESDWVKAESTIHYSTTTPGFIEILKIFEYLPVWFQTDNTFINNTATTKTKLLSSIPINNFAGNKLNRSFIVLYLMESVFSPTVLLPDMNVQWRRVNNSSARANVWSENLKGSAIFHFNTKNEVTKIVSTDRYLAGKLDYTKETFTIHLANYKDIGDYYIPTYFELQWNLAGNDFTFGRFQITDISYE